MGERRPGLFLALGCTGRAIEPHAPGKNISLRAPGGRDRKTCCAIAQTDANAARDRLRAGELTRAGVRVPVGATFTTLALNDRSRSV
jgi:hypothetical protein